MKQCHSCGGFCGGGYGGSKPCQCNNLKTGYRRTIKTDNIIVGEIEKNYKIIFHINVNSKNQKEVGRLEIKNGVLTFQGFAEESARLFFDNLVKPIADKYLRDNAMECEK